MANTFTAFANIAQQLGLDTLLIRPKRQIGDMVVAQATIREVHDDELEITDQPVEQGANITDNSFKLPEEVLIEVGYSNSPGSSTLLGSIAGAAEGTLGGVTSLLTGNSASQVYAIYQQFLRLQSDRVPCDVWTGKRFYRNMLVKHLHTQTDKDSEYSLRLVVRMRQIIMVPTATNRVVSAPQADQAQPQDTAPTVDEGVRQLGPAPAYNGPLGDASIFP